MASTNAQSLLALDGALDKAVIDTGNPDIDVIIERHLPGSTGESAGWFEELTGFPSDHARSAHNVVEPPVDAHSSKMPVIIDL